MCNEKLVDLIRAFQEGRSEAFIEILAVFERLMRGYSRRIHDEDAYEALTLFLVELAAKIVTDRFRPDKSNTLQKYVAVCIRNHMIALSKTAQEQCAQQTECEDMGSDAEDWDTPILLRTAMERLSPYQKMLIALKYYGGFEVKEIAAQLKVSRQAVNQTMNRGLTAMRAYIQDTAHNP